jgi:hypothetical protein
MFVLPIDYFLVVWFVMAGLSTAYVAWDQFKHNPEPAVMKWGFVLVTLYMGVARPLPHTPPHHQQQRGAMRRRRPHDDPRRRVPSDSDTGIERVPAQDAARLALGLALGSLTSQSAVGSSLADSFPSRV